MAVPHISKEGTGGGEGGTCSNDDARTLRRESRGKFSSRSANKLYSLYVPPSREPLVWAVDIGFDICTSRSSAIFIARIKRQTSFVELSNFYIILVANIVPSKNLKLRSHPSWIRLYLLS